MGNKARHDFRANTIEVLAKRVGYICSNPSCKSSTVGPGGTPDSIIKIGIAAHITAASPGGPRYDPNLSIVERTSIENGIWLCVNCSVLIDRDFNSFPKSLLLNWKSEAERNALKKILGNKDLNSKPRIQPDLIWSHSIRRNQGPSKKNQEKFGEGPHYVGIPLIMHWEISFEFILHVFNNSTKPAFNIKVESDVPYLQIDTLRKINNLPPLDKLELGISFKEFLEDDYIKADEIMKHPIPEKLINQKLKITFEDEFGTPYSTIVEFNNEGLNLI